MKKFFKFFPSNSEELKKIDFLSSEIHRLDRQKQDIYIPPSEYTFSGNNNKLLLWEADKNDYIETFHKVPGLEINVRGSNNFIKIGCPEIMQGLNIIVEGNNHKVVIGRHTEEYEGFIRNCTIYVATWVEEGGCEFIIGDNPRINSKALFVLTEKGHNVLIGNNCRFAEEAVLFAADGHSVVDKDTKKLLNRASTPVIIGDNCWIGFRSFLTKRTVLPDFTIVAAMSVVSQKFNESYTIIAGNPARIVKNNVQRVDLIPDLYEQIYGK